MLDDICHEDHDPSGIDDQGKPPGKAILEEQDHERDESSQQHIASYLFHRVGDGVLLLSYEIAQQHRCSIAGHTSPGTGPIAVFGYEQNVHG